MQICVFVQKKGNGNICVLLQKHHYAPQSDCLNLSFVQDEDTYGKKTARNGLTTVI